MKSWAMALTILAGLMGACGVGVGAAAAHVTGGGALETAGFYLLVHAAAVGGIALNNWNSKIYLIAASFLALGAILFGGDIALRTLAGFRLFPMAAPTGGMILIAGWLVLALGGVVHLARRSTG